MLFSNFATEPVRLYTPETKIIYFGAIGGLSIILSIILYFMAPKIKELMKGIH